MAEIPKDHSMTYQITTRGRLDASWGKRFTNCRISLEKDADGHVQTILTLTAIDQSSLRGVINKLWDLNLSLISVRMVAADAQMEKKT